MEVFLIRHAQSLNNARPEADRVADPSLTDLGHEQAHRLALWARSLRLTRLITSPFLRALQTTEKIRDVTGMTPEVRTVLHEQGGCYSGHTPKERVGQPGMTRWEIEQQFPGFSVDSGIDGQGWWKRKPYEAWQQAALRAGLLLQRTREEFGTSPNRVAYVMHADIKLLLLQHFHRGELPTAKNAAVTRIVFTPMNVHVSEYNCVEHLPRLLVTG